MTSINRLDSRHESIIVCLDRHSTDVDVLVIVCSMCEKCQRRLGTSVQYAALCCQNARNLPPGLPPSAVSTPRSLFPVWSHAAPGGLLPRRTVGPASCSIQRAGWGHWLRRRRGHVSFGSGGSTVHVRLRLRLSWVWPGLNWRFVSVHLHRDGSFLLSLKPRKQVPSTTVRSRGHGSPAARRGPYRDIPAAAARLSASTIPPQPSPKATPHALFPRPHNAPKSE